MDELNYFSRDKNLPMDLTIRLRTFFQNTQHVIFARQYDSLLQKMSPLLRGQAALKVAAASIGKLPYFGVEHVEGHFLASAALAMKVSIYSLREFIPIEHLTIIERGIAAKAGRLKIKGSSLGHDMILELPHLRDWSPVTALTVTVQVMYLPRDELLEILPQSPRAMEKVRRAAFKIAFQRLVMKVADEYRIEKALKSDTLGGKIDFIRLTMPTAVKRAHERAKMFGGLDTNFTSDDQVSTCTLSHDTCDTKPKGSAICNSGAALLKVAAAAKAKSVGADHCSSASTSSISSPSSSSSSSSRSTSNVVAMDSSVAVRTFPTKLHAPKTGASNKVLERMLVQQSSVLSEVRACRNDVSRSGKQVAAFESAQANILAELRACQQVLTRHEQKSDKLAHDMEILRSWVIGNALASAKLRA